jgi:hypothetical protein
MMDEGRCELFDGRVWIEMLFGLVFCICLE